MDDEMLSVAEEFMLAFLNPSNRNNLRQPDDILTNSILQLQKRNVANNSEQEEEGEEEEVDDWIISGLLSYTSRASTANDDFDGSTSLLRPSISTTPQNAKRPDEDLSIDANLLRSDEDSTESTKRKTSTAEASSLTTLNSACNKRKVDESVMVDSKRFMSNKDYCVVG
jgi:hypothetical protein